MKKHILAVDDEKDIRELLQESLSLRGYRVLTAPDAETARKIARADWPNLIILDLQIEKGDGLLLIDEFKRDYPNTPIMLLTGALIVRGAAREAVLRKVSGYLDKTASLAQIVSEIQRLIGEAEGAAAPS